MAALWLLQIYRRLYKQNTFMYPCSTLSTRTNTVCALFVTVISNLHRINDDDEMGDWCELERRRRYVMAIICIINDVANFLIQLEVTKLDETWSQKKYHFFISSWCSSVMEKVTTAATVYLCSGQFTTWSGFGHEKVLMITCCLSFMLLKVKMGYGFCTTNYTFTLYLHPERNGIDLPSMLPGSLIVSPSSRRNVIVGGGEPVAEHFNVTLLPSFTTMSVLVG